MWLNCKVIKKRLPPPPPLPPFQLYSPFLAKNLKFCTPPGGSIFGRSYTYIYIYISIGKKYWKLVISSTLRILIMFINNESINLWETLMSICMQKLNLSVTSFLRHCQEIASILFRVIWIGLVTYAPKMIKSIWRNLWCFSAGRESTSSFTFSWRYCKDIADFYFGYFGHAWLCTFKVILPTCENLLSLYWIIKSNFIPHIFLEILPRYTNFLFWMFWACLVMHTQNDSISS